MDRADRHLSELNGGSESVRSQESALAQSGKEVCTFVQVVHFIYYFSLYILGVHSKLNQPIIKIYLIVLIFLQAPEILFVIYLLVRKTM
jgi:hypothetical protein